MTMGINQDRLKQVTQKTNIVVPTIIGTIMYRMGFDTQVHQTGFVISVQRNTSSRPDRSPNSFFLDEGDVPTENVKLLRSILEGGYAD